MHLLLGGAVWGSEAAGAAVLIDGTAEHGIQVS